MSEGMEDIPQSERERSPFGGIEQLKDYLRNERQPLDYAKIISPTTRVLALGETHASGITKSELIDQITQLKNLGFTHIGMETFKTDFQPLLDEYQATGERKDEVMNECKFILASC
jgi:hypothetical protein